MVCCDTHVLCSLSRGTEFGLYMSHVSVLMLSSNPDSKVHWANMGPIWGRQDPGEPHFGPMNFVIWEDKLCHHGLKTTEQDWWHVYGNIGSSNRPGGKRVCYNSKHQIIYKYSHIGVR